GAGGNIFLMNLNQQGHIVWVKDFFGVNDDTPYDMILNQNGGASIVGSTYSFGTGNYDGIFLITDSLANVQHTTTYGTPASTDEIHCILKIDNGYILGGANREMHGSVI